MKAGTLYCKGKIKKYADKEKIQKYKKFWIDLRLKSL